MTDLAKRKVLSEYCNQHDACRTCILDANGFDCSINRGFMTICPDGSGFEIAPEEIDKAFCIVFNKKEENNAVNHPSHYTDGKIEVIDFIEDKGLGFHLGNVVKYVARAGKKNPDTEIQDLKKAEWYLHRHIEQLEEVHRD